MSYKKKKYLYITRRSMHHQHHTTKLRQQHALSVRNAECGHVPHPGIFVLDLEQGTGTTGNGVPKSYGTLIQCCENMETVQRRFKTGTYLSQCLKAIGRPIAGGTPVT
jgi:hypothetical protein